MLIGTVDQNAPKAAPESGVAGDLDDDGRPKRTGTVVTAITHIITAVIGSGVLSLAWGIAQLGWIAGVGTLLTFASITYFASSILADCYRYPSPEAVNRNYTYMEAVQAYLGGTMYKMCGLIQYSCLSCMTIGYTITASISMVAIRKSRCPPNSPCKFSNNPYMIAMGIAEIFLSQIPNFHKLSWLSTLAAAMSFGYSFIGMGLAFAMVVTGKGKRTSLTGLEVGPNLSAAEKTWSMFRAFGNIAFACGYSLILIEVQDCLRSPPPENKVMKQANRIAMLTTTTFYLLCGCFGYAAFGNNAPGNLLVGFASNAPSWIVDMANVFIVVHLLGAYQVLGQPVFKVIESWVAKKWPTSTFVKSEYPLKFGTKTPFRFNFLRLIFRTSFVVIATVISMALPFFNDVLALLGAMAYWPLTICFPVAMHIAQNKIKPLSARWIGLQILNLLTLLVTLAAAAGAIQGFNKALRAHEPFRFKE